jgi:hypothetical protein
VSSRVMSLSVTIDPPYPVDFCRIADDDRPEGRQINVRASDSPPGYVIEPAGTDRRLDMGDPDVGEIDRILSVVFGSTAEEPPHAGPAS